MPGCRVVMLPVADGGEGTVEALEKALGAEPAQASVHDPLGRPVMARYATAGGTAVLESAAASGLTLLAPGERDPLRTSTLGTGELAREALRKGCRRLLIGLGGSATNDGGMGFLTALGWRFLDAEGALLPPIGASLERVALLEPAPLPPAEIIGLCDVRTRFSEAARVFAPQKGADASAVERLEQGMRHFARVVKERLGIDLEAAEGTGAAGGLGGGLLLVGARLCPGIDAVLEAVGFEKALEGADLVITGEGCIDAQTLLGKVPGGVLRHAGRIPVVAIAGRVESRPEGFRAVLGVHPEDFPSGERMNPRVTAAHIEETIARFLYLC